MPLDTENIGKALTDFENDAFMDAKDKLSSEVRKVRDEKLKEKLGLTNDINPLPDKEEKEEEE